MAYIEKKKIKGHNYFYLKESKRIQGKVKTKTIAYLGKTKKQAQEKLKQLQTKKHKQQIPKCIPFTYEDILELASRRSLFYPSAEIYTNAPAGFWNFGPYGTSIRRKIIQLWRKELVEKEDMIEIYGSQILPEEVFQASGHLKSLVDPIIRCKKCKLIYRADKLLSTKLNKLIPESISEKEFDELIQKNKIKCPKCNSELSKTKKVSLMVETKIGISNPKQCYLRPEACQSIFLDFLRMSKTMRLILPKGIAQVGRAFRNEISPRQSLFREIEFSQFEIEIFFNPKKINEINNFNEIKNYKLRILRTNKNKVEEISAQDLVNKKIVSGKLIAYYLARTQQLYEKYGIQKENIRFREVSKEEKPFYSKETFDLEVLTKLGWIELVACNYRTDYDLKVHSKGSKQDLTFTEDNKKFTPHIFEISAGVDRTFYAIIDNAFKKEIVEGRKRIILSLNPKLSPYDTALFPLVNKKGLPEKAKEILKELRNSNFTVFYDAKDSIGRRYRRCEEVGISNAITIDFQTLKDNTVTLRDSTTMKQIRIKINKLKDKITKFLEGKPIKELGKIIN